MHHKILLSLTITALAIGSSACERHSWESTKALHQEHGGSHDEGGHEGAADGEKEHHDSEATEAKGTPAHQQEKATSEKPKPRK
ncbi:MAG: hypothetical protein ACC661_08235, partial [Verrucomicrobiales bacterium]